MPEDLTADWLAGSTEGFDVQRQNNWVLTVSGLPVGGDLIIEMSADTFNLPQESNDEIELHWQNEKRFVAGKVNYESGTLVVKDMLEANTMAAIIAWRRQVSDPDTGNVGRAHAYKKEAILTLMGPDNTHERSWRLIGIWPQSCNYGTLDMSSAEPVKPELTLRYDKAKPLSGF